MYIICFTNYCITLELFSFLLFGQFSHSRRKKNCTDLLSIKISHVTTFFILRLSLHLIGQSEKKDATHSFNTLTGTAWNGLNTCRVKKLFRSREASMVFSSLTPTKNDWIQSVGGPASSSLQRACNCLFMDISSFITLRQKYPRSYFIHSHHQFYRWKSSPNILYQCTIAE